MAPRHGAPDPRGPGAPDPRGPGGPDPRGPGAPQPWQRSGPDGGSGRHRRVVPGGFDDDWFDRPSTTSYVDDRVVAPAATDLLDGAAATCRGVRKVYRTADEEVVALTDVDKDFPRGRVTSIVGPSGSGKSSLLRILACVDRPTVGSVLIDGREVSQLGPRGRRALRRRSVAYVFQNPIDNLVEYLDVTEQLKLASRLRGVQPDLEEMDRLLRRLGLEDRATHKPVQLSGGEQQRVAVACAVVGQPAIVVADEPTAELDSGSAERVLQAVHDMRDEGVAFIVSSHDPAVVAASDHVLRLEHGRVVESW